MTFGTTVEEFSFNENTNGLHPATGGVVAKLATTGSTRMVSPS